MLIYECNIGTQNTHSLESLKSVRHNLCNESSLFTDYKTEDAEAYYITLIKCLLRTVEPSALYNASKKVFPVLKPLLKYSHHSDVMIKNAARISLMTIFQKCQGEAMEHINSVTIPKHGNDIVLYLKQIALDMQHFHDRADVITIEKMNLCYMEELEYIDDLLRLNPNTKELIVLMLISDFIVAFIFPAIMYETQQTEHTSQISCRVGLYLLSNLLQTITDVTMKNYITELILQEGEIMKKLQMCKNIQHKSITQLINSLQIVLLKYKTDIDTLYTLQVLYSVQTHILDSSKNLINFFDKFLYSLIKSMFHYQFNSSMEGLKLKLLVSLLKPLTQGTIIDEVKWQKLQIFFSQAIGVLYSDIFMLIEHKIENLILVIDEEYDIFVNMEFDINKTLEDINCLTKNATLSSAVNVEQIGLYYFFHVRSLYITLQNKKETVLPIMKNKAKIGEIMCIDSCCIHCRKLTDGIFYDNKHFLKWTDNQLLILESRENYEDGKVIFNSYYKDIIWSMCRNDAIKISEALNCTEYGFKNISKSLCIQLKFYSCEDLYFVVDILQKARLNQIKLLKKKFQKLKL